MTSKELYYFIGNCISLDVFPSSKDNLIRKINENNIDWERFEDMCNLHAVLPVVYLKLKAHDLLNYLPEDMKVKMSNYYNLNKIRNLRVIRQIRLITGELSGEGIYPVFINGVDYIIDGLYSDPGERVIKDIDFLIAEKDHLRSEKMIRRIGFSVNNNIPVKFIDELLVKGFSSANGLRHLLKPEHIINNKKLIAAFPGLFIPSDHHRIILNAIHQQSVIKKRHLTGYSLQHLYDLYLHSKKANIASAFSNYNFKEDVSGYYLAFTKMFGYNKTLMQKTISAEPVLVEKENSFPLDEFMRRSKEKLTSFMTNMLYGTSKQSSVLSDQVNLRS